jgi:hypothetical protein
MEITEGLKRHAAHCSTGVQQSTGQTLTNSRKQLRLLKQHTIFNALTH